jgi:5-formyltetrahydrofolate cyclo-ligase
VRADAKARRAEAHAALGGTVGAALRDRVLALIDPAPGTVVSAFLPFGEEIDTLPLLTALHARGAVPCAPVSPKVGRPLTFRRWWPGVPLERERFGTACPAPEAGEAVPAILIVPMLAFDRAGNRLGYGAGFYDRTLAGLRAAGQATAIGVAYAAQEVDAVPVGAHDQPLDAIVTERETLILR